MLNYINMFNEMLLLYYININMLNKVVFNEIAFNKLLCQSVLFWSTNKNE